MPLEAAISLSIELKDVLTAEVTRSRAARAVLKAMKIDELLVQATERDAFNHRSTRLSESLARALDEVATAKGERDVTLGQLAEWYPFEAAQLAAVFAEIRSLSSALKELDAFNQTLAERALTFVRAYVAHLSPRPAAYGRRGRGTQLETTTYSEHA